MSVCLLPYLLGKQQPLLRDLFIEAPLIEVERMAGSVQAISCLGTTLVGVQYHCWVNLGCAFHIRTRTGPKGGGKVALPSWLRF
jgi:hypothetical protein